MSVGFPRVPYLVIMIVVIFILNKYCFIDVRKKVSHC